MGYVSRTRCSASARKPSKLASEWACARGAPQIRDRHNLERSKVCSALRVLRFARVNIVSAALRPGYAGCAGIAFRDDGDFDQADSLFGISEIEVALLSLLSFQITIVLKIIYNNSNLRLHNNSNILTL